MSDTNNKLTEILLSKISHSEISNSTEDSQDNVRKITALHLDKVGRSEAEVKYLSITLNNAEEKKCLCEYLSAHNWPCCDYLYIEINEESENEEVNIYLIEQKDILASVEDRIRNKKYIKLPRSVDIVRYLMQQVKDNALNEERKVSGDELDVVTDLIIHKLAEDCRKKFFASISLIFRLQMDKDIAKHFPLKQTYHFALLNEESILTKKNTSYARVIKRKIKKHQKSVNKRIEGYIKNLRINKKLPEVTIGETIDGFNGIIKSIDARNGL